VKFQIFLFHLLARFSFLKCFQRCSNHLVYHSVPVFLLFQLDIVGDSALDICFDSLGK